jgi:hypothetical protein
MRTTLAFLLAFAMASPALASRCPMEMAAIDAALQTAQLSEADMAKVRELRARGEELHNAGDHAGSVEALDEAKALLGI